MTSLFKWQGASQDAKVDLKALIIAVMPIYCLSETINLFIFLFLCNYVRGLAKIFWLYRNGYKVDIYRTVNGQTTYGPAPKKLSLKLACTMVFFYAAT